jgi:DNA-directed RNA polymerase subunit RPC12/RpoP
MEENEPAEEEFGCYRCGTLFASAVGDRQSVVCPDCGAHLTRERAETTAVVGYEFVRKLHRLGPCTVGELGGDRPKGRAHNAVGVIAAPNESARNRTSRVYYLWGDERRAVRHFIMNNTEWAREQVRSTHPVAKRQWPEPVWGLFLEEWQLLTEEGLATERLEPSDA